jgi:hypothetical protein
MTGAHGVTEQRTDTGDDRLGAAGLAQLGLAAAAGIALAFGIGLMIGRPFPWVTVVVLGVAFAVLMPVSLVRWWWARGGRTAVLETRAWVRSGRVPDAVPDEVWRPRVRQLRDEATRHVFGAWGAVVLACLWSCIALIGDPLNWALVVVWACIAVVRFGQTHGQRAAAQRLLDEPVRAVATV